MWLRGFIEQVAFRLWSPRELPHIPSLPRFAPGRTQSALPPQLAKVVGRAVSFRRDSGGWADGVALPESAFYRDTSLVDGVGAIRVQRPDGAVAWLARSALKGLR